MSSLRSEMIITFPCFMEPLCDETWLRDLIGLTTDLNFRYLAVPLHGKSVHDADFQAAGAQADIGGEVWISFAKSFPKRTSFGEQLHSLFGLLNPS